MSQPYFYHQVEWLLFPFAGDHCVNRYDENGISQISKARIKSAQNYHGSGVFKMRIFDNGEAGDGANLEVAFDSYDNGESKEEQILSSTFSLAGIEAIHQALGHILAMRKTEKMSEG